MHNKPVLEPANLGKGWCGFDFEAAFGHPVKVVNDALMQAIGAYEGGRMLFLGLGTGLGSAMIVDNVAQPLELAHMPYKKGRTFEDYVGERGLEKRGKKKWRQDVFDVVEQLKAALRPDYVVIGGGNVKLPEGDAARRPPRRQRRRLPGRLQAVGQGRRDHLTGACASRGKRVRKHFPLGFALGLPAIVRFVWLLHRDKLARFGMDRGR